MGFGAEGLRFRVRVPGFGLRRPRLGIFQTAKLKAQLLTKSEKINQTIKALSSLTLIHFAFCMHVRICR